MSYGFGCGYFGGTGSGFSGFNLLNGIQTDNEFRFSIRTACVMKTTMFILIYLQLFLNQIFSQDCTDDIFEIEIKSDTLNETLISYRDKKSSQFLHLPKFVTPVEMDRTVLVELISIQKLDSIERVLFTSEELDCFKRGIAFIYIHIPSGRIVSTSFYLKNKVDLNKLKSLKEEFEKNLHFKVKLAAEIEKEGYWGKSFRIFVSRNRQ